MPLERPSPPAARYRASLAAFIGQLQGELARLAAALDASGGLEDYGYRSAAAFLRTGCQLAPGRAGELVTAGRGLSRLPVTEKALAAGDVSFDQAVVVTRTAAAIADPAAPADPARRAAAHATAGGAGAGGVG